MDEEVKAWSGLLTGSGMPNCHARQIYGKSRKAFGGIGLKVCLLDLNMEVVIMPNRPTTMKPYLVGGQV